MKKTFVATLGVLALVSSSASVAASVQIIPTPYYDGSAAYYLPSQSFVLTVNVTGMPGNGSTTGVTGGSFTLSFDSNKVAITDVMLPGSPTVPWYSDPPANTTSNPFDFISPPIAIDANNITFSVLRNGTVPFNYASGSFTAFKITGIVLPLATFGPANIVLIDDGLDNSWTDQDANAVTGVSYTQADVGVRCPYPGPESCPLPHTPLPAAVWLLGSALGVLGVMRRRAPG